MDFEDYTARWQEGVVGLSDRTFGKGYFDRPSEIARDPDTVFLLASEKDELLGFAQGRLLPPGRLQEHLDHRLADIPSDIAEADGDGVLAVIQAVAVAPQARGKGIGTKLLTALHDKLVGMGADKLVIAFKRGRSASDVDGMMRALGFDRWTTLPSFWRERCESGDFNCVDRHADECRCEALLYRKAIF